MPPAGSGPSAIGPGQSHPRAFPRPPNPHSPSPTCCCCRWGTIEGKRVVELYSPRLAAWLSPVAIHRSRQCYLPMLGEV